AFNIFYDAGTLIVICRRPAGPYAEADCWLAAENLMLAACAKRLGTCCIGFALPALNAPEMKRELGIPENVAAVVPIIIGYPRGKIDPVPRKPAQILRWVK
ncbi:MAG TPA: nitroreductase family protein, partial [Burkholderiales bacterium]|nr:nitroreductase family protein [Burkholderiales bacterium]